MTIKSSNHIFTNIANSTKQNTIISFIDEYRHIAKIILNDIWDNGYTWTYENKTYTFNIHTNQLYIPQYIDYNRFNLDTKLTARALSSLVNQLVGVIRSATEKQRKRLYILDKQKSENIPRKNRKALIKKIKQNIPQKPNLDNLNPELSSKCASFDYSEKSFTGFIKIYSILKGITAIYIPIDFHKHSRKLSDNGTLKTSYLITKTSINLRWDISVPEKKTTGKIVGADQGAKTTLTLSDNQQTQKCIHGHDLDSIMHKMAGKDYGSKAFKRAEDHRKNYINWALKQLDLSDIKQINLEEIINIGYKNKTSRYLKHFTNTLIRDKVMDIAEGFGVQVNLQSATYRSQRCNVCGLVRKSNRKKKTYECIHCGNICDADINAAKNHECVLPEIPYELRKKNMNRGAGFFWKTSGFYEVLTGRSLESLPLVEDICHKNI